MNPCNDHFQMMQQCHLVLIVQETVQPPSDHDCFETLAPSGDHCFTETETPSSDHYCIDIVMPSSDHCYTETVPPSSDHCCTKKMAPPSDHLHTKRTEQRKLTGEKTFTKSLGAMAPVAPSGYARQTDPNALPWPGTYLQKNLDRVADHN